MKVWSSKCKQLTEEKEQLKQQCVLLQGLVENKEQVSLDVAKQRLLTVCYVKL